MQDANIGSFTSQDPVISGLLNFNLYDTRHNSANEDFDRKLKESQEKAEKQSASSVSPSASQALFVPWSSIISMIGNDYASTSGTSAKDRNLDSKSPSSSEDNITGTSAYGGDRLDSYTQKDQSQKPSTGKTGAAYENIVKLVMQSLSTKGSFTLVPFSEFLSKLEGASGKVDISMIASKIVDSAKVLKDGESSTISLKLKPEWLGSMTMDLSFDKGLLSIKIYTAQSSKYAIESNLNELENALKAANINVGSMQVFVNNGGSHDNRQSTEKNASETAGISASLESYANTDVLKELGIDPKIMELAFGWSNGNIDSKI